MMQEFFKYQGTGNDFVMIDNRSGNFKGDQSKIAEICDRRFGVGADGLILIENLEGFDFKMVYYNADGNLGSMCGNGGRCTVKFAHDLGIIKDNCSFLAADGPHLATIKGEEVSLQMKNVEGWENIESDKFFDTGSPHLIKMVENLDKIDVNQTGKEIRYSEYWVNRGGTNVNFVEDINPSKIKVRTYERGVENETYSCGTGVTAAALNHFVNEPVNNRIEVETLGGELKVEFDFDDKTNSFFNVYLKGPAKFVFKGFLE